MKSVYRSKHVVSATAAACLVSALASGCASAPPPPELDLERSRIVPMATAPALDVNGLPGGKAAGAGVGAASGSGYGALAGVLLCAPTGFFIGICLATVLPATAGAGALTGAAVGAARTESLAAMEEKTRALEAELKATPYHALLGRQLSDRLRLRADVDVTAPVPQWTLETGIVEIGTEGKGEFALRMVASVRARREGSAVVAWEARREVQSESELTLAQWLANDAVALRGVTARCIDKAAEQLAHELNRGGSRNPSVAQASRSSSSCDDEPTHWLRAATSPPSNPSAALPPVARSEAP